MDFTPTIRRRIQHACGRQSVAIMVAMLSVLPSVGCRICQDCEDMAYPAYGGAWERTSRDQGRVGSLFEPAGARASNLVDKDLPPEPDEIERMRQAQEGSAEKPDEDMAPPQADDDSVDRDADGTEDSVDFGVGDSDEDFDAELDRRGRELQDLDLQDIQVFPGKPLPPIL